MPPKLDSLVPPSQSNKRLFYQGDEKEIIFRDSSVINSLPSSHLGSDSDVIRSSSRSVSLADDQLSTEPIPIDFDHVNLFRSSPFCTQQVAPVTALNVPNQIDDDNSAGPSHQVKKPKLKMDETAETSNNERQLRPRLTHRDPPITRARGRQVTRCINGFDGSVEGHSSADGDGLANPSLGTEGPKSIDDDDDEYQLSESENNESESEQFTVNDIKKSRKTTNKKPSKATYSSKPRGKQAAKAKAAPITVKQTSRTVTNKITVPAWKRPGALNQVVLSPERLSISPDEASPVLQNTRTTVGGSNKKGKDVIADSQDFVKDSQENAIPPKSKSRTTNNRRPKIPFFQDSLNTEHINLDETTSAWDITDTYPTAHQGKAFSPSPELLVNEEVQASNQSEPIDFGTHQPETTRSRGNNGAGLKIDKGKTRAVDQNHSSLTSYEVDSPQSHQLSDQPSQSEDVECVETCLQSAPPYHTEVETNEILDNFEPSELSVNEMEATPTIRDRFKHVDVYTPVRLHQLNSGPVRLEHVIEAKNEATQTDAASAQQLLHEICYPGTIEEGVLGNNTTNRWFSRSPRLQGASRPSRVNPVTAGARKEYEQSENLEKGLSTKKYRHLSDKTTPLHPTSRAWAQGIAKKSRQNNLKTSAPQINAGETETLGQTPGTIQESNTNPISKREIALGCRRSAIVDSVQEITMTVLQHLESKESSIDSIVGIYQQRGQQILGMLLDRQSIELRQAASDFDGRCLETKGLIDLWKKPNSFNKASYAMATDRYFENPITSPRAGDARDEFGLYSGPTSIALLFYRLSQTYPDLEFEDQSLLDWTQAYCQLGARSQRRAPTPAHCGIGDETLAHLALSTVISEDSSLAKQLCAYAEVINSSTDAGSNEWLYGRAGYLYLLRLCRGIFSMERHATTAAHLERTIISTVNRILSVPQPWVWHGKQYIGAVHGSIGIITQVVLSMPSAADRLQPLVLELLNHQFSSGNFPSSLPAGSDRLVQFCHGGPGFVISLRTLLPYFPTISGKIKDAISKAQSDIWRRGLLTKEPCLCHGIAGNALALDKDDQFIHFLSFMGNETIEDLKRNLSRDTDNAGYNDT
ncbi:hypothetical protein FHL15_002338 [Xylaria flabelliformis]|uniref:Uncharacterized protein n=1 Tax=Xylaria flabelliformis TaxID=2512241 RepID=A0A553I918_9PEZI|nr:hypothetical protein FHL15_002338 [Xylaria flabelliformis]